jgi:hypothetical protein
MFLSLALNYMNVHGNWNTITDIRKKLLAAHNVPEILDIIIAEIEKSEFTGLSAEAVEAVLKSVFCSRAGLTAAELTALAGITGTEEEVTSAWIVMENNLQLLLVLRSGVFNFSHDYVRQAVHARYFARAGEAGAETEVHKALCEYFMGQASSAAAAEGSTRAMKELTYHQHKAGIRPSVMVVARIRPFGTNERERQRAFTGDVCKIESSKHITVADLDNKKRCKFSFDCALDSRDPKSKTYRSQEDVFKLCCDGVIAQQAVEGYNSSILAYGQTGSGKTYSMFGQPGDRGLIYRVLQQLMGSLREATQSSADWDYSVSVSMVEVKSSGGGRKGDETLADLLDHSSSAGSAGEVRLKEKPRKKRAEADEGQGTQVANDIEILTPSRGQARLQNITRFEALEAIMEEGYRRRATRGHQLNDQSSRSHCIFTVCVFKQPKAPRPGSEPEFHAKINLVDLAGSERGKKTFLQQGGTGTTSAAAKEAISINSSLSALNACIEAVAHKKPFVPYRNSKLTRILQDTLGGTAKTVFLATVSPCAEDRQETLSTLGFAALAKQMTATKDEAIKQQEEQEAEEEELADDWPGRRDRNIQ